IPPVPVRYMFTPAAAVSARPFAPVGVVETSDGPGESTMGNVGRPLNWIVRLSSNVVVAERAAPARAPTTAQVAAAPTNPSFHRLPGVANRIPSHGNREIELPPSALTGCLRVAQGRCEQSDDRLFAG